MRTDLTTEEAGRYTVGRLFKERTRADPDHPFLIYQGYHHTRTYGQIHEASIRVAKAIISLTGGKRSHAAFWAPNIPDYLSLQFGSAQAGIPLVLVNPNLKEREVEYILFQSDARILFIAGPSDNPQAPLSIFNTICPDFSGMSTCSPRSPGSSSRLPRLEIVIFIGPGSVPGLMSYDQFLKCGDTVNDEDLLSRMETVLPDDIYLIQYTSGTTGRPKGAMQTHAAYCVNVFAIADRQDLKPSDISCIPLPLFHALGCLSVLAAVAAGASVIVGEGFNPATVLTLIESCRATMLCGTPTMFIAFFEEIARHSYDLSSLRGGNMSGSPCPPDLVRRVCTGMGAYEFGVLFGSTESLVAMMNAYDDTLVHRSETMGATMPGVQVRIVDPISGMDCIPGQQGEICIRGPSIMAGYYRMPEAMAEAVDADGWYHSGDMASRDSDGYHRITGRIKDIILRGGETIYPAEIEEFLMTHPKLLSVQVVGVSSEYYGEEAVAFVRAKPGESVTPLELKQFCRNEISIEKVPSDFFTINAYPVTASGKVQKFRLREMAEEIITRKRGTDHGQERD